MNNINYFNEGSKIRAFTDPLSCKVDYRNKSTVERLFSYIKSINNLFLYFLYKINLALQGAETSINKQGFTNPDIPRNKKRLIVCLHGLNDKPAQFHKMLLEMQKQGTSSTDVYIPYIPLKGNATLDEMRDSVFKVIEKWAKSNNSRSDRELILIGISNGGRISRAIEARVNELKKVKKVRVISIVGANNGSTLINLAHKIGLSFVISKNIAKEMGTDSERNQQLRKDWSRAVSSSNILREYIFLASPHDWQVPNYDSSLMKVPKGARPVYAIITGHGHISIVKAVSEDVAHAALKDFDEDKKKLSNSNNYLRRIFTKLTTRS